MNIISYQIHQLKDLGIEFFLIMPERQDSGYVCHVHSSAGVALLVTQKNNARVFKTLDAAYKALLPMCKSKLIEFKVGFNVDDSK